MIREMNISPETQVQYDDLPPEIQDIMDTITVDKVINDEIDYSPLKGTPYIITPAGVCYDQSKHGIVPHVMTELYNGRKAAKKQSINHKKNANAAKAELQKRGLL